MALSKQTARELYRPVGPKPISLSHATPDLTTGGTIPFNQAVDLSLPIRGFQIEFRGRDTVAGTMASVNPEGFLNFITSINIAGVNARQQGNLTLWNAPLSDMFLMSALHQEGNGSYFIDTGTGANNVAANFPATTPFPAQWNPTGVAGTYDFRIVMDIPVHPFSFNGFGKSPFAVPLFALRNEEWKDSLQLTFTFGAQGQGAVAGVLGTGAAGVTHTFSAYGQTSGTPQLDLYSLPFISGLTNKDSYLPGVLSRVNYPINTTIQSPGTNVNIANLQKQPTPRIYVKVGTSTVPGAFTTLSDTNVSTLGIQLGGNRSIRNPISIFAHKLIVSDDYGSRPVQGMNLLDFVQNGNYDSHFPGQDIGDGSTYTLQANVAGVANAAADIVQEQMLHAPSGALAQ